MHNNIPFVRPPIVFAFFCIFRGFDHLNTVDTDQSVSHGFSTVNRIKTLSYCHPYCYHLLALLLISKNETDYFFHLQTEKITHK